MSRPSALAVLALEPLSPDRMRGVHGQPQLRALVRLGERVAAGAAGEAALRANGEPLRGDILRRFIDAPRGNPYDNAKAESFMKTLKVEAVYLMAYETFEDVTADLPRLHRRGLQRPQTPLRARLSEPRAIRGSTRPATCQNRRLKLSTIKGALQMAGFEFQSGWFWPGCTGSRLTSCVMMIISDHHRQRPRAR